MASDAQYYDEMNAKLSTLKQTHPQSSSWVDLLVKNLTEDEILKIVAVSTHYIHPTGREPPSTAILFSFSQLIHPVSFE